MLAAQSSVAQLVAWTAVNRMVAGSSPARGAASSNIEKSVQGVLYAQDQAIQDQRRVLKGPA